jgi:type I restriction enzyme R subunit
MPFSLRPSCSPCVYRRGPPTDSTRTAGREAQRRGEKLGLSEEEVAFYDAPEANDSAVAVLGDETLRKIARELVEAVRRNITIDWAVKENVRAKLRVIVNRILRRYGYPPNSDS